MGALTKLNIDASVDNIAISDGTDTLAIDGSGNISVNQAGTWDIATVTTLTGITNDVNIADGGNSITVDATQLDIDDLAHGTDSVAIGDGTDLLSINADGSLNITDNGGSITVDGTVAIGSQAFVYAEDSVHTTADEGAFMLAVRADSKASTAGTDGDYAALIQDADGDLYVTDTVAQGYLNTLQGAISGSEMQVDVISSSGQYAEDSAHTTADTGNFMLAVRNDTEGTLVSTDGDYAPLQVDSSGRLRVIGDLDVVGNVADDAADSGNPLKVGSKAYDQGSVWTSVGANDRANQASDLYRRLIINDAPNIGLGSGETSITTTATNIIAAPQAGRMHVYLRHAGGSNVTLGASGVVAGTGLTMKANEAMTLPLGEAVDLYGRTASTTATMEWLQLG
jgi:hypothetical protein